MKMKVLIGVLLWLLAAAAVMASGVLADTKPPTLQLIVAAEVFLLCVLFIRSPGFAEYARSTPRWRLTVFHLWRLIPGIGFLILYHQQLMPREFAVPAGVGDIVVAVLAPIFTVIALRSTTTAGKAVLVYHVLGLVDLFAVVSNAARVSFTDPASMRMLSQAPLVIVPIFWVPLTILVHIVAIDQCRRVLSSATRAASNSNR